LDWRNLNHSPTGKAVAMALVVAAGVAGWTALQRYQPALEAKLPLPGVGLSDPCAIWFIGSSTIQRWNNLPADMAPWKAVKRGVDGAKFAELTERFGQEPTSTPPRAIVLYAGENDLAEGATPAQVLAELQGFLAARTRMYGPVPVLVISLKPSPTRWANRPLQQLYNAEVRQLTQTAPRIAYVEIGPLLMDGAKPGNFYVADGIHLTPAGYRRWTPALNAALSRELGAAACGD
jgi:hypothetical protein